jgi:outer membrane biosynthesis protein TonB
MANLRDRNPNNSDGSYNEPDNIPTEEFVEPGRATSYRDGYVHGRVLERRHQDEVLEVRDNNNAARGLLIGISLASLLGLGLAAFFFWNQRPEEAPTQIIVPQSTSPSPQPAETQNRTTVIERQVEKVPQVIVPQQPASAPQQSAPKININVPRQAAPAAPKTDVKVIPVPSAPQQAPAPKQDTTVNITPPQSSTQKSTTSTTINSTSSNPKANPVTPSEGTQNQTDTQSGTDSTP